MTTLVSENQPAANSSIPEQWIVADAHVHLYDCFELSQLLDGAIANFNAIVSPQDNQLVSAVLLLTETQHENQFQFLSQQVQQRETYAIGDWIIQATSETVSLCAQHSSGQRIFLIAGRQIVTSEKLEVSALITEQSFADGLPLEQTIQSILAAGGLPVLPWGVGKWVGQRGRLLNQLLQSDRFPILFLGDNSGRPIFWPRPALFQQAEAKGLRILPGTDPLPLSSECDRPGQFGFKLRAALDQDKPGQALKQLLLDLGVPIQSYGRLESPVRFIQNQWAIRREKSAPNAATNTGQAIAAPATSPIPTEDRTVISTDFPETADIETSSDDYASRFAGKTGAWFLKVQEKATLKLLAAHPKATVLDVGGGHGQITEALIQNGYQTTVLGSAEICRARIQKFVDAGLCQFAVGNVLDLPYPDNAFDVVISYRFLPHVTQWESFLKELCRVAKTAVIVDYPTVRSVNYVTPLLFKFKKGLEGNTRTYTCFNEAELMQFFRSLALKPSDRYPQFFFPMVLHRALKQPGISALLEGIVRPFGLTWLFGSPVILKLIVPSSRL
jgi:ubiquinone/menaquinone biosynthesis C-methylase UbiE